uniref:Uncharacterized protein n=1 Tax=Panagrolaimus sp. JU765 TaxID=591449 RepID=A0AC34QKN8_9BILA
MNWLPTNSISVYVSCLLVFIAVCLSCINAENTISDNSPDFKVNPYALPLLPHYRMHRHQKHLMNLWATKNKNDKETPKESMERLRRSYLPYGVLDSTPTRRSASHPCRWKLCGAHFGYNYMRRL